MLKIKKLLKEEKIIASIVMVSFVFCILFIFTNRMPELFKYGSELMNFLYAISISIIAASIFYVLIIYLPGQKRKNIIKHNFEAQYIFFKEHSIAIFLSALGESPNAKIEEKLCDLNEFKKYFKEKCGNYPDKWHKVWDELNGILLKDLLVQLDILSDEASFILNNTEINDENVLSFFKLLLQSVYGYRIEGINMDYDEKKRLMNFLWELFAGWSFADGYREEDIVKLIIEKI